MRSDILKLFFYYSENNLLKKRYSHASTLAITFLATLFCKRKRHPSLAFAVKCYSWNPTFMLATLLIIQVKAVIITESPLVF